jgi:hypothetical protein
MEIDKVMYGVHRNLASSDDDGTTIGDGKLTCSSDQEGIHDFMLRLWIVCTVMFFFGGCSLTTHPVSEDYRNQISDKESRLVVRGKHKLALTTSIAFEYQTYKNYPGVGGWTDFPLSPNNWKIRMHMTNEDLGVFDVIPIFLFNERYKKDAQWVENSMGIGSLPYQERLSREVAFPVRAVPEYAPGVVSENVFLQRNQHDFPPSKEETGGFYDALNMRALLQKAGERQPWKRQPLSPQNALDIEWDAWSIWAFPEDVRQSKDLIVSTLGPVMIPAGKNANHAVIPVVEFVADNPKKFHRLNGKHVQLIELSVTGIHNIERSSPEIHAFLQALLNEFTEK